MTGEEGTARCPFCIAIGSVFDYPAFLCDPHLANGGFCDNVIREKGVLRS